MAAMFLFGMLVGVLTLGAILYIRFVIMIERIKRLSDEAFKRFIAEEFERSIV